MSRRTIRRAAALVGVLALAAHLVYWYWPRARATPPSTGDLARTFPASRSARVAVWLPYPHQNLAALDRRVGDLRVWIRGIAGGDDRHGRVTRLDVPSFGPFLVPPARELSAELGPDGELRVAARLYPSIAALARAAGTVASNPWLAGGDVSSSDSPATVRWDGRTWTLTRSPSPSTSSSSLSSPSLSSPSSRDEGGPVQGREAGGNFPVKGEGEAGAEVSAGAEVEEARPTSAVGSAGAAATEESLPSLEVFGLIWLGERLGPLPSSVYRVVPSDRVSGGLEVLAGESGADRSWAAPLVDPEAGAPVGWLVERDEADRVRGIAVWEGASGVKELPAIVVFGSGLETDGSGFAFELPGEGLLRLVGERAPEAEVAGLRLRALDRGSLERAAAWVPTLAAAFFGPSAGGGASPRALAGAAPDRLARLTSATARLLRAVPLVDPADAARFERVATLLQPIAGCRLATLEVGAEGAVRLAPCD